MHPSEAITLQDALADSPQASVLVSADAPHAIHMANDAFLCCIERSRFEVLGRPLHQFHGESDKETSDISDGTDTNPIKYVRSSVEAVWSELLRAALGGRIARCRQAAFLGPTSTSTVSGVPAALTHLDNFGTHCLVAVSQRRGARVEGEVRRHLPIRVAPAERGEDRAAGDAAKGGGHAAPRCGFVVERTIQRSISTWSNQSLRPILVTGIRSSATKRRAYRSETPR